MRTFLRVCLIVLAIVSAVPMAYAHGPDGPWRGPFEGPGFFVGGPYPYPPYAPFAFTVVTRPAVVYAPSVVVEGALPADQASPTFTDNLGRTCRIYESQTQVNGYVNVISGKACLWPDGTWRVVN